MDLELWRLRFGRTNASIRQAALIWRRDFDVQETETWFQIGTMLQYRCFMHKPIYRCIDRGLVMLDVALPEGMDQGSPESEACCNQADRLCLFPHGFT